MQKKKDDDQTKWQKFVAGIKDKLSEMQGELDEAGVKRKDMKITPEAVDAIRNVICETYPEVCEGEEPVVADLLQGIVDVLSEEIPETDVEEEMALVEGEDKQDEDDEEHKQEEEEEEEKALTILTAQVTDLAKSYNGLISDMSDVARLMEKTIDINSKQVKENDDLRGELDALKKQLNQRPRRASRSPETEVDPDSEIAKAVEARNLKDVPEYYKDIYTVSEVE